MRAAARSPLRSSITSSRTLVRILAKWFSSRVTACRRAPRPGPPARPSRPALPKTNYVRTYVLTCAKQYGPGVQRGGSPGGGGGVGQLPGVCHLAILQEDPALKLGTPEFANWIDHLQFKDFGGKGKTFRIEQGRKLLMAGAIGGECSTVQMCGQKLMRTFPFPRAAHVILAFCGANKALFEDIFARARAQLRRMGADIADHVNIKHFLEEPLASLLITSGECHVSEPGDSDRGFWDEPLHNDGAGSLVHLSLTAFVAKFHWGWMGGF